MTKIKLHDGVYYDGRQIDRLTLRPILAGDVEFIPYVHLLPGALVFTAHLSGEPLGAINLLTMDDVIVVLEALGQHMSLHAPKRRA